MKLVHLHLGHQVGGQEGKASPAARTARYRRPVSGRGLVRLRHRNGGRRAYDVSVFVSLDFGASPRAIDVYDGQRVRRPIRVEHHGRLVGVLPQVQLQAVAVLGRVVAVGTPDDSVLKPFFFVADDA
jgi:hypothetical protein